VSMLNSSINSF